MRLAAVDANPQTKKDTYCDRCKQKEKLNEK